MSATLEQLQDDLLKLNRALATGALKIEFRDRSVWYRGTDDLLKAIRHIEEQIAKLQGTTRPTIINVRNTGGWQ